MSTTKTIKRVLLLAILALVAVMPADAKKKAKEPQAPKYVFYLIGDGMGINEVFGAQMYNAATGNGPEVINFTQFPYRGFVTTYSSSSLVTDSAAAGTALATGQKTYNDGMGVAPDGVTPVANLSEWAHAAGFGAGVATTVGVNHATPAAFYAHTKNRNEYEKIAEQLIAADNIDFAAGGGFLNEVRKTGHDSHYLEAKATEAGIAVLHGKDEFKGLADHQGRVICFAADREATSLPFAMDRKPGDTQLCDFVEAGIDYLYGHFAKKGFFFMIEGGEIDSAGHSDDGVCDFVEINDFAAAIDLVLAFYDQHPDETLIVVTADHETGAFMLGSGKYEIHAEMVKTQYESENAMTAEFRALQNPTWEEVQEFFRVRLGLWDVIPVDARQEQVFKDIYERTFHGEGEADVRSLYASSARLVSDAIDYSLKAAGLNWAHGTHTGSPVGLYVKGATALKFAECRDNTDVPMMIKAVAGY